MIVGIDDTDSTKGGCTTHTVVEISKQTTLTHLRLIRLNPNIPYKTRGNGAVSFHTKDTTKNRQKIIEVVEKYSRLADGANPGVVFINKLSQKNKKRLYEFYKKTTSNLVTKKEAVKLVKALGAETFELGNGRGIIGALAAVGARLPNKTFELITYRSEKNYSTKRRIDADSVFRMNEKFYPQVFDSIDEEKNSVLITPRGRDPIYCGIRGESRRSVWGAWRTIKPLEEITSVKVFETNQGTDAHLARKKVKDIKPYDCVVVEGVVSSQPKTIVGGHVFFKLNDGSGAIDCGAYKPTGGFRNVARNLREGDVVAAAGGVGKYSDTINLEKVYVKKLIRVFDLVSPRCCGRSMTSAGKNKGFKCRACGKRKPQSNVRKKPSKRKIKVGWYEVPPRARRHLSKPLVRMKK